jgi:ferredoxin-type protein NapG
MSRRNFFKVLGKSIAQAVAEFTYEATKPNKNYVRPPGSADEDTFLKPVSYTHLTLPTIA